MAQSEQALKIELTRGALNNGYISIPSRQSLFPARFIADDAGKSEERFSLELPGGRLLRTCILGRYGRLQARLGSLFKELRLEAGDCAVINAADSAPDLYLLTFETRGTPAPTNLIRTMEPHTMTPDLNRIFFGPPGTGKTFATIDAALEILDPDLLSEHSEKRDVLKSRFDELMAAGDIRFVTFHQSFSYEDFVEGLRAETSDDGQLRYEVVDGIFKSLCTAALARVTQREEATIELAGRRIWKMSLGNSLGDDAYIFEECIENNCALLGYGGSTDFGDCKDRDDVFKRFVERNESVTRDSYPVSAVNTFLFKVKEGDLLIVSEGNMKFRAIGEVVGPYRRVEREEQSDSYGQYRPVKWLRVYKPALPFDQLMNNQFSQMTLYELRESAIDKRKLRALLGSPPTEPALPFKTGDRFGTGYSVVHISSDLIELEKPNGNRLPIGLSIIKALAEHVRNGELTLDDIRDKHVFEKLQDSKLEPGLINGYSNIFLRLVERYLASAPQPAQKPSAKVLIIDEINRGNVSRIFGELITLIERSKRKGAPEALEVVLPYSKTRFSVPENVYLIATMNTADRSLTGLDIALRRRFSFVEMAPDSSQLEGIEVSGIDIEELLETMNQRIEVLLDRDHRIGHAYFLPLRNDSTMERLSKIFSQQVCPLLEEYFFEDWTRIQWVFNDHRKAPKHRFVTEVGGDLDALFGDGITLSHQRTRWQINSDAFKLVEAYLGVIDHERQTASLEPEAEARKGNLVVRRMLTGSIQVWENGARLPEAKATLRELASELGLNIHHSTGTEFNTRALGNAVIKALSAGAT
ncbi:AAA family ATPase [Bradyrhizobium sp. S3.2.12]|uniref:AAA family ATPase n=1 Tax=Bradyrhizobium sp. S3.2.12 TaxID=3156387 RepID=UPI0033970281